MGDERPKALPNRADIDPAYKWKLEDIYPDNEQWEKDFLRLKALSADCVKYKGRLGSDAKTLLEALNSGQEIYQLIGKVFAYARMRRDEDNANSTYQAFTDRANALMTEAFAAMSYMVPEIVALDETKIERFINEEQGLKVYRHFLEDTLRKKAHVLSEKEEELLALSSEMGEASSEIYAMYNNADIRFPNIIDENGNEIELTQGRYIKFLESTDGRVRHDAFKALYNTYAGVKNTLAATLSNQIKRDRFYATVRKYDSSIAASLDEDNISLDVYDNLLGTINSNLNLMHRYVSLRKKALKLDKLHMYDLYVPIVEEPKSNIPYEEGLQMVKEGLTPLGSEYGAALDNAMRSGWIDVYENRGKTTGAYSWGNYDTHPFILLNYQGTVDNVFTIAHELGHALHSWNTNKTQEYVNSHYGIFVAEVASTVNESLLLQHLLRTTTDPKMKAYLLNHRLESFKGTIYRQVMFAEFEKIIHGSSAAGEAMTAQALCDIYYGLNKKYFGDDIIVDEEIRYEWARIPHFYTSFYVYKYATGLSAATSFTEQILNEGKPAVDRYIKLLQSGGSDYPLELLKRAGVDLTTPAPVADALKVFETTLDEMEATLKEAKLI